MSALFGDSGWRRLAGRERELLPRLVRPAVLALLWLTLAATCGVLGTVVAVLGELR